MFKDKPTKQNNSPQTQNNSLQEKKSTHPNFLQGQSLQGETCGFAPSVDTQVPTAVDMAGDCSGTELQIPSLWIQQSVMDG